MNALYTPPMLAILAVCLLLTGVVGGLLAGLLGVGGGIVIVPVLFLTFNILGIPDSIAMHLAVATSLATIIPTSISSSLAHRRRGTIDFDLLRRWAVPIFIGAGLGGILAKYIASHTLTMIFGVIALLVSINMALPKNIVVAEKVPENMVGQSAMGALIGFFSALMGIGGGTLTVPTLTAFSFPVHRAVGTAATFGLVIAIPAVLGFIRAGWGVDLRPPYSLGFVSLPAAVLIFSASVFVAPIGARLAHSLNPRGLRRAFAVFLFLSSLNMIRSVLGA